MPLELQIERSDRLPVHAQLALQIRLAIRQGILVDGDLLPTSRELAAVLGVNVNTVARVYRDLRDEGFLLLSQGRGTFVRHHRCLPKPELQSMGDRIRGLAFAARELGLDKDELATWLALEWPE